jgi:dolichyl-phosphate-mannose--protein O-mannosyl transferase
MEIENNKYLAFIKKTFGASIHMFATFIYGLIEYLFGQEHGLFLAVLSFISFIAMYIYRVYEWKKDIEKLKENKIDLK